MRYQHSFWYRESKELFELWVEHFDAVSQPVLVKLNDLEVKGADIISRGARRG